MDKLSQYKKVLELRKSGENYVQISKQTGVPRRTVMDWCKGKSDPNKLKGLRNYTISDEDFKKIVQESFSIRQVLSACGIKPEGGNYRIFKERVERLNLDTSHFTGQGYLKGKTHDWGVEINPKDAFVEKSSLSTKNVKSKILKYNLLPYICSNCGISKWQSQALSLHLDHINGINNDNRLENLRFLCPNCHSQTDTYCGKNKKN